MAPRTEFKPTIVGFLCNWCCYGGADLCGVSRFQYPPYLRVIRLMCSGRVDLEFIFRAFAKGADGVFIGGCHLNDCHYNPEGNYDALGNSLIAKRILEHVGVNPDRLRLEWVSAGEGIRFAEVMNDFSMKVKNLGPFGTSEATDIAALQARLEFRHPARPLHQAGGAGEAACAGQDGGGIPEVFQQRRIQRTVQRVDFWTSW